MSQHRSNELSVAIAAVRRAARVCQAVQSSLVTEQTAQKKDKSPVTVADYASQAVVCSALDAAFPNDPIVGEEGADELRTPAQAVLRKQVAEHVAAVVVGGADEAGVLKWIDRGGAARSGSPWPPERFWTLDPIDGTKGFLRKEQYAIALALIVRGEVVLGVLGCPNLPATSGGVGSLFIATRGGGAFEVSLDGGDAKRTVIHVDSISHSPAARFCESVESGHSDQDASSKIASTLGITAAPLRMDSQAKYASVARGDASIYLRLPTRGDYRECIWDHAAGAIVIEEAGGRVTDVDGKPLDFSLGAKLEQNRGVIATNGKLHAPVLDAVRKAL